MYRPHRTARASLAGASVLIALAGLGTPHVRAEAPPALDCEPVACAAAYIGKPVTSLTTNIANEASRTGTIGIARALDQLDTALTQRLSASPGRDAAAALDRWMAITTHDAIRDLLLTQSVTVLRGALGG